jgi:hypothetical protein
LESVQKGGFHRAADRTWAGDSVEFQVIVQKPAAFFFTGLFSFKLGGVVNQTYKE